MKVNRESNENLSFSLQHPVLLFNIICVIQINEPATWMIVPSKYLATPKPMR